MDFKSIVSLCFLTLLVNVIECHQGHQDAQPVQPQGQPVNQHQEQQHHDPMSSHIDKEHVLEHLDGVINKPKEQMTHEEQNFYYFKLHDYDNNNMLDGLELVSAFVHNEGIKFKKDQYIQIKLATLFI